MNTSWSEAWGKLKWCLSTEKKEEGNFHQRRCCVEANRQLDREEVEEYVKEKGLAMS